MFSSSSLGSNQQQQQPPQQQPFFNNQQQQNFLNQQQFDQNQAQQAQFANPSFSFPPQPVTTTTLNYLNYNQYNPTQQQSQQPQQPFQLQTNPNFNSTPLVAPKAATIGFQNHQQQIQTQQQLPQQQGIGIEQTQLIGAPLQAQQFVQPPPNSYQSVPISNVGSGQVINGHFDSNDISLSQQRQQQPFLQQRPFSQQQQQHQPIARRLPHQRSLPLPPPVLQQIQARQHQQHLNRHYYQAANKINFDDDRYYAQQYNNSVQYPNHPLLDFRQTHHLPPTLNQQSLYSYRQPSRRFEHQTFDSTRGLYQNSFGGYAFRSMANEPLLNQQALLDPSLDADQRIVNEFRLLYSESRQLFNGLR